MKVGARITAAVSALVTLTLGIYTIVSLRGAANVRTDNLEREARELATALRASIEAGGVDEYLDLPDQAAQQISRALGSWQVTILPRSAVSQRGGAADRLRTLIDVRQRQVITQQGDTFRYMIPLRVPSLASPDGFEVAGALELSRSTAELDRAFRQDLRQTLPVIAVIAVLTIIAIYWLTRTVVTQPIQKLLDGIDDVAQGDLSRVLLSERDDEIGALATRFNEMTFSLRESRAETRRQNEAKLGLEQRLSHTEKLATIGQLSAEIAHEVGTPLNVIAGRARALGKKADNVDAVVKNASIIAEQSARIARIIQRMLDFTRRKAGAGGATPVNLNELSLTSMDFLEGQFAGARVKTTLARAEGLPAVLGDPDRLQQVLINLLLNAVQAMPGGGTLRLETSRVTRRRPGLEVAPEQDWVLVEISDSGVGIPAERRDKIFEPFYTSRGDEGGTGLGLAVCHGIVKDHDGWIEIGDAPTGGTVFAVHLPVAEPSA